MKEEKPNQKERITIRADKVKNLIPPEIPVAKTEEYILNALEHYKRFRQRKAHER
jgi:ParB family chromosome partitioning protein